MNLAAALVMLAGASQQPSEVPLLPLPREVKRFGAASGPTAFNLDQAAKAHPDLADAFLADWPVLSAKNGLPVTLQITPGMAQEEHSIKMGRSVVIQAGSEQGLAWGLSTLAQMGLRGVKSAEIRDAPTTPFRCLMLDVARRYHSPSILRQMVRWCSAAKVGLIQLHLTDHQNWMLPTKTLTGVDKRNSHGRPAYSVEEIRSLVRFASARGVALVPEIDVPGHSALLIQHDRGVFKIKGSPSEDCINFGSSRVRTLLKSLIAETAELFHTSPYIHLGGDEASHPDAERDPEIAAAIQRLGPDANVDMVFADFLGDLGDFVLSLKKRPVFWEGFRPSDFAKKRLPKKALIVAWEGAHYPAQKLIDDGFSVVNAGWDPFYVVNHYPWDAYTLAPMPLLYALSKDRFGIVNWTDESQRKVVLHPASAVKGAMLCWWEGHEWNAQATLPRRILAFGARLWNPEAETRFESFSSRADLVEKSLVKAMFPFAWSLAAGQKGLRGSFAGEAELLADRVGPGMTVRAEMDKPPTKDSPSLPIKIAKSGVVQLRAFQGDDPVGEAAFVKLDRGEFSANLALGARAVCSTRQDPQFPASSVTDGFADHIGSFWLAYPLPATLTVTLKEPQEANRIEVVPFWAAGQGCQYRVEVSRDGRAWHEVTDSAALQKPVTKLGGVHRFSQQKVGQVRVTILSSAQYPPSMGRIHEVRVLLEGSQRLP